MSRILVTFLTVLALSGCKLAVIVVEGGEVQSTASGTCAAVSPGVSGNVCIHEITDTSYNETFTAVADTGFDFDRWSTGGDFFCADSTDPVCVLSNGIGAGNPGIESIIASDRTYYLMPIFKPWLPITDFVVADGLEWAQPVLFIGASRAEIEATCSGGACAGSINGHDATGWVWATGAEVAQMLYNEYGLGDGTLDSSVDGQCIEMMELFVSPLSPGYPVLPGDWTPEYAWGNDLRPMFPSFQRGLGGVVRDTPNSFYVDVYASGYPSFIINCSAGTVLPSWASMDTGAWLYRTP
jgi:hypothetical protein